VDGNDALNLRRMLDAIEQLEFYTRGMSESEFTSAPWWDAVARQIEIVGEAAKNVSIQFQDLSPKLPGQRQSAYTKIVGEDFKLNISVVWDTFKTICLFSNRQSESCCWHEQNTKFPIDSK
jgi:uncharacterized protein with HEPN domain